MTSKYPYVSIQNGYVYLMDGRVLDYYDENITNDLREMLYYFNGSDKYKADKKLKSNSGELLFPSEYFLMEYNDVVHRLTLANVVIKKPDDYISNLKKVSDGYYTYDNQTSNQEIKQTPSSNTNVPKENSIDNTDVNIRTKKQGVDTNNVLLESASGANVQVLFEFPNPVVGKGSYYMLLPSVVSLSCSVSRAKMPVVTLGECTTQGFALGNKTVAGSIIKTLLYNDEFDKAVKYYKDSRTAAYDEIGVKFSRDLSSKNNIFFENGVYAISQKDFLDDMMRDDLIPFNIYTYSFSEYGTGKGGNMLMNSIYGCTIINEGQVQSIENLITENTFTYVAKYARLGHTKNESGEKSQSPNNNTTMTGSNLIKNKKRYKV